MVIGCILRRSGLPTSTGKNRIHPQMVPHDQHEVEFVLQHKTVNLYLTVLASTLLAYSIRLVLCHS